MTRITISFYKLRITITIKKITVQSLQNLTVIKS